MTNIAPMSTMFGLLKPASASFMVSTPVNGSSTSMINATASTRGLLMANMTMAAASSSRTSMRSVVICMHLDLHVAECRRRPTAFARAARGRLRQSAALRLPISCRIDGVLRVLMHRFIRRLPHWQEPINQRLFHQAGLAEASRGSDVVGRIGNQRAP